MLSPEDICANINRVENSERLNSYLDRIDSTKIDENSHSLTIKQGMYIGATLLLCALTKLKWRLVNLLIEKANIGSIDVYVVLKDSDLTVISFIPDYLMCDVIEKAKFINVNAKWRKSSLLREVLMEGHIDILLVLLRKGLIDPDLLKACMADTEFSQKLPTNISETIANYLNVIKFIPFLPQPQAFNNLMRLLSQNEWLLQVCQPNSKGVTFKDQIITKLSHVPGHLSKPQLQKFYKRFPQFKPADFQIEDTNDVSPLLSAVELAPAIPPQPHQNGVTAIKTVLTLSELLYQGKHEILISRLQTGEIAFDSLESFVADNNVDYECKNIINACLNWRTQNFGLPDKQCFTNLISLFQQNDWLFKVRDEKSKKSLLELTMTKLGLRRNNQLDEFKNKFPGSDTLLNQINTPEPPEQQLPTPERILAPQEISADINNARTDAADVSRKEMLDKKPDHLEDSTSGSSVEQSSSTITVTDSQNLGNNGATSRDVSSLSSANNMAQVTQNHRPIGDELRRSIVAYRAAHAEGSAPASSLAALMDRQAQLELRKARTQLAQNAATTSSSGSNANNGSVELNHFEKATTSGNHNELVNGRADSIPPRNIQQVFGEITNDLSSKIYNRENISYQEKPEIINSIKSKFIDLITHYGNNKVVNESNRHDLLDVLCALYKNICEPKHKKKINIHNHARYDRFFRKPNTQSWQEMVKDIRDNSLNSLLDIAAEQVKSNPTNAITFLKTYIDEPLFCEHRSNVAICRMGVTSAVGKIKDRIKEYEDVLLKTKTLKQP